MKSTGVKCFACGKYRMEYPDGSIHCADTNCEGYHYLSINMDNVPKIDKDVGIPPMNSREQMIYRVGFKNGQAACRKKMRHQLRTAHIHLRNAEKMLNMWYEAYAKYCHEHMQRWAEAQKSKREWGAENAGGREL